MTLCLLTCFSGQLYSTSSLTFHTEQISPSHDIKKLISKKNTFCFLNLQTTSLLPEVDYWNLKTILKTGHLDCHEQHFWKKRWDWENTKNLIHFDWSSQYIVKCVLPWCLTFHLCLDVWPFISASLSTLNSAQAAYTTFWYCDSQSWLLRLRVSATQTLLFTSVLS